MVVFSQNLNQSLDRAIALAEQQSYHRATPEHVLLALIDDPDAMPVMRACNVDLEKLRGAVLASMPHSDYELDPDESGDAPDADESDETLDADESEEVPDQDEVIPVEHFQVVLARAIAHARASECEEVNSTDVLVAMLERPIGGLLNEHGMTRYDVTTFISHGISKDTQAMSRRGDVVDQPTPHAPSGDAMGSLKFEVRILNDNYTPMDFVVYVLEQVFDLAHEDAERVMLQIHREGEAACGTFIREEAEAKATQVMDLARQHLHPLRGFVQG
jgi:ATP-dependent Clp protease adapter protein ClpS